MCQSMAEFEELVKAIQFQKAESRKLEKEIEEKEKELKSYLKKRKKEQLFSRSTGLTVSYKQVDTPRFNKKLFISTKGEEEYEKYLMNSSSMRLNYLKNKQTV